MTLRHENYKYYIFQVAIIDSINYRSHPQYYHPIDTHFIMV